MNNKDSKKTIFNKVASLRTNINKTVKNKIETTNKFINNNETIQFLIDLLKTLENISEMARTIIDMIHKDAEKVEAEIKNIILKSINSLIYCSSDAKTPLKFIDDGITIKVSDIDFNQMLYINPMSDEGSFIYFDRDYGINSRDFNTFLYNVLKVPNTPHIWGPQGGFSQILTVKFMPAYNGMNDVILIKISPSYKNIKFTKFFHDLLESMDLIDTKTQLNSLIDSVYGTVSENSDSAFDTLRKKTEIDSVVNRMVEYGEDFDTSLNKVEKGANKLHNVLETKTKGLFSINDAESDKTSFLSIGKLKTLNDNISSLQNVSDIDKVLVDALYSLGTIEQTITNDVDIPTINYKFIENIVKNLGNIFVSVTVSPKIVLMILIAINHKSSNDEFDIKTFMKNNSGLFNKIISGISGIIIGFLFKKCEKAIKKLVEEKIVKVLKEKAENRKKQLKTLK